MDSKSPQEKKRLSYAKDRRNSYGENSKASRKNIPRAKARANRLERHHQNQIVGSIQSIEADDQTAAETRLRSTRPRSWRKRRDMPLGTYLVRKAALRTPSNEVSPRRAFD